MSDSTSNLVPFVFNSDDQRPLPEIIADLAGFALAYHDLDDGRRVYAVQDWIIGVARPASHPGVYWREMKKRFKKTGFDVSTACLKLPYRASDGKTYQMDHADAEMLYQITQRMDASTGIRDQVLKYLAQAGVLVDEIRIDPDKALEAAIAEYRRQGRSEAWINARILSVSVRVFFTEAFAQSQRIKPSGKHFAIITDTMRMGVWKRTTKTIRTELGLKKQGNVRNNLPVLGLIYEMAAEQSSGVELEQARDLSFDEANSIIRENSELVGKQASEISRRHGIDLVTGKPLLKNT